MLNGSTVMSILLSLKTVLTSIQYFLFLTLHGEETNFRGHKLTQNKVQKNRKGPEKVSNNTCEINIIQVPKNEHGIIYYYIFGVL